MKKRVRVGLPLGAKQLRQLRDISCNAPRVVFRHQVGGCAPFWFAFVVDVTHRKAVRVFDDEASVVGFLERLWRRKAVL